MHGSLLAAPTAALAAPAEQYRVFVFTNGAPAYAGGGFVGVGSAVETEPDWQFLTHTDQSSRRIRTFRNQASSP